MQRKRNLEQPSSKRAMALQFCALAGIAGPIFFVLGFTIAGWLDPGYSPLHDSVSSLGAEGPYPWIQNTTFVLFGLLLLLFALGFFHQMRKVLDLQGIAISTVLLMLTGAGLVNDGFFTEGPVTTLSGMLHGVGFLVLFGSLISALFLIGGQLRTLPDWRGTGWYSTITGVITLGILIFSFVFADALQLTGLFQRILVAEAFAWYVVTGARLFTFARVHRAGDKRE